MRVRYTTFLAVIALLWSWQVQAQRIVNIPAVPGNIKDVFDDIMGDTTATGERVDNNTIYTLDNGGLYISSDRLVNKAEWPLQLQAVDLTDLANKPIFTRIPDAVGAYPQIAFAEGDVTFKNIWFISGETGPGEEMNWGQIRFLGTDSRVIVEDCIIEKDRGGFLQIRADGVKMYVNRCILRNGGNRKILEGNGRGIESRTFVFDTLIVKNTVIHNIIDRVFRSQGGTLAHNYIEFDRNTIFNVAGRHGCFQLRWVNAAKITNNLMINPMMLGTTPALTDEQNQPDNEAHKIFTLDTITSQTTLNIANNSIFWTQDVIDVWAMHDTVSKPDIYSALVKQVMGDDTLNSYIEEVISLNSVPGNITQYIEDLYADPTATDMFDFIVEDISAAGTNRDFGNLFDFSTYDPCYDPTSATASAGTGGSSIGYVLGCAGLSPLNIQSELNNMLNLNAAPNPFSDATSISYNLSQAGQVKLTVFDMSGKIVSNLHNGFQFAGEQQISWQPATRLPGGMYLLRLETEEGSMMNKLMVQ